MTLYSQKEDICSAELDGSTCLFDPSTAEYLNLNSSGSAIWNEISEPKSIEDIVSDLLNQFDVDPIQCSEETGEFLEKAINKGMIVIAN